MREDIALALDGSAILLVALGLWLAFQRRRWPGVAFAVLGLGLMSGTATLRAYPNPTRAALHQDAVDLRGELAAMTEKWRKAVAVAEERKQGLLRAEAKVKDIEKKLTTAVEANGVLTKTVEALRGELKEARREADEARRETDKVRSGALARVKDMIAAGLSTKFYQVSLLPERELVAGKPGTYFSIRLKDQSTAAQFIFPKGRYIMPASEGAILEALHRLATEVVSAFDGVADYQLFVRGGADAEPLAGAGELLPEYSSVAYRPLGDGGKYATETTEQSFHAPIANSDLPLLRAAYFRSIVGSKLAAGRIDILYNMPSKQIAEEYRTVEFVLYVK